MLDKFQYKIGWMERGNFMERMRCEQSFEGSEKVSQGNSFPGREN